MSREPGDPEAGQHKAEEEPFLHHESDGSTQRAHPSTLTASFPHQYPRKTSSRSRPYGFCKVTIFSLFLIITSLGLAGLLLNVPSEVTRDRGHGVPSSKANTTSTSILHHHHEHVPPTPRVRDGSEYVLSPSWDAAAAPVTREYHWTITDARLNPDGVYRPMILINNQFPGPLVECNEGDTIIVQVQNKAVNATSIHFHGLFQNGTNFMDGTVGVTQCPIAPNSNFTYKFDVRGQSGTYWYHAHHSAQAADGLVGPLVIHSKGERTTQELDYATDRIVMIQDHYHNTTSELLMDYLAPDMENNEPVPDNPLINGRGVRSCDDFKGWDCDGRNISNPVFDLTSGQRHRLRFINVGVFAELQVQIDQHPFYITEVDGTDVHPEPFHRLNILPAQRYSIVLETNVTAHETYWLRARMVSRCFTTKNKRLKSELRGVIRYISPTTKALKEDPTSKDWPESVEVICRDLNTSSLIPVQPVTPPPADDFVILRTNFQIGDWALARGFFNESSWHPNATHPSLHRFLDLDTTNPAVASLLLESPAVAINDKAFNTAHDFVLQTRGIRTVDISINNFDDGAHPFHLHGHKFFVMAQARSGYPPATADAFAQYMKEQSNGRPLNPLRRDTVTVEGYSWVIIRVVLDNPGLWSLHCHNMWHAMSGMAMQVLVRAEEVHKWKIDAHHRSMCRLEGVTLGARPDDEIWYGTLSL
ncbi:hypothetical protein E4U43_004791 [Claviceps pusilla]|uniref:Laccase n=1 Tax=Claviceps pusilla TaxID=123648 RepID=A0A9P7N3N3_9HYPO|nr:hypothetical protein E4U43_004791 [Claviceps pusilla]